MTEYSEDLANPRLQTIEKPWVIPVIRGNVKRIFGSSRAFYSPDDGKDKLKGSTVPLKVKEYYQAGHRCLGQEDWESAVLFFSRALHLDPTLVEFYVFRAEAFIQLCDFSSAAQNLRRALSFEPNNTQYLNRLSFVLYLQGQCLYEQCDYQDALNVFLQASALQPHKDAFRYRCMACLLALKRHQDCLTLISREVRNGMDSADIYILRARIYNFFQKPKLCFQDLRNALLLEPKHPQAQGLLQMMVGQAEQARRDASILAVQGKLDRALKRINCALDNNPLDPSLFLFRGTMYRRLQQFDPAVEDFLKVLDMVNDSQDPLVQKAQRQLLLAYNDFAVHCYMQGAYQEGVLLLNKAIRDEQKEKGLYINRGDCFFQLGNLPFAEADYKQALELSPQDEGANMRMGVLQEKMGYCQQTLRQFQKAEDHFSVAIKHNPQKAQYYLHRAKSRHLLQDTFGAQQDMATVLLLNPKQPKIFSLLTNLFPGMSVQEVLNSEIAHLAKLQLQKLIEGSPQSGQPLGIVGQRLLERQKAQALKLSWKQEESLPKEQDAVPQPQQPKPEGVKEGAKAPEAEKKGKREQILHKMLLLSDSYEETSSGSIYTIKSKSTSGMEASVVQDYKSTSFSTQVGSDSSLPNPESSDSWEQGLNSPSEKAEASRTSSEPYIQATAARDSKTPSLGKIDKALDSKRRPSKANPRTQNPSKSFKRTQAARSWSWKPNKTKVLHSQSRGLKRSSSKVKISKGQDLGVSSMYLNQDLSQAEAAQSSQATPKATIIWEVSALLQDVPSSQGKSQSLSTEDDYTPKDTASP